MTANLIFDKNYLFRDYVTEDISSYGIGSVWTYHFKETLIGVRDIETREAWFVDLNTVNDDKQHYVPTIEQLKPEHLNDAVNEVKRDGEVLRYIPMSDIMNKAKELVLIELGREMDAKLTGKHRSYQ